MSIDERSPCLIGTARRTWHPGAEPTPEPLEMWDQVSRSAALDAAAAHDVLGAVDHLGLVHCHSWAYDRPADRLADRLGIEHAHRTESILAGTSPQRLLDEAATKMLRGESRVALVVGGEALATRRSFDRAGEPPPWSHPHPSPPLLPVDLDEWYLPTEIAHGIIPAWLTFALLEQARWAARGGRPGDRSHLHQVIGRLREVAVRNPDAWFTDQPTTAELINPSATNRMVATPYTKRMTAFLDVDMAAANLLVTKEIADTWRVPDDQRVYLRGWGFSRDAVHIAARARLDASPAMGRATAAALHSAGLDVDDMDVFDLYSCFGSAVQFAADALGLEPDDPRSVSLTGGLPYHGGPSSNYVSHAISHLATLLRSGGATTALTTGVGMHMTKHVAAVWSRTPGPIRRPTDDGLQHQAHPAGDDDRAVAGQAEGTGSLVAAIVVHDGAGRADHVVAICELPDRARCYARSDDAAVISVVLEDQWVDRTVTIKPTADGTNALRLGGRRERHPS